MDEQVDNQLLQIRRLLLDKLDKDGIEYDKVEIEGKEVAVYVGDRRMPFKPESPVEAMQRIFDEDVRRQRELEQVPIMISDSLHNAVPSSQVKLRGGGGKYSSVHGDVKREKARAKRKQLKKHKRRGR